MLGLMDSSQFFKSLTPATLPVVLLLHGAEPFLVGESLKAIVQLLFPDPTLLPLNRDLLEAKEARAEEIADRARTLPCLSARRLVVVRGAGALAAKSREALMAYLASPNPSTCLVFVSEELLPASHWLVKAVPPGGVVEHRALAGAALLSWLRAHARSRGIDCSEEAISFLVECVGEDLLSLVNELEKASLSLPAGAHRLELDMMRAIVGEHRTRSIFELTRALERRDVGQGLAVLERLLAVGEEPLSVLGMIAREWRQLWQAKEWRRQGRSAEEIARMLRRPARVVEELLGRAESTDAAALRRGLRRCWEVDQSLKSGGQPRAEMTLLFAELCRQ